MYIFHLEFNNGIIINFGNSSGINVNQILPLSYTTNYAIIHTACAREGSSAQAWNILHFNAGFVDLSTIWCGYSGGYITIGF